MAPQPLSIDQLWSEHGERIRRAALMLTGNVWDADDLVQETFVAVADSAKPFEGRSALYTWLYGILLNLDRRRRRQLGTHQRKMDDLRQQMESATSSFPAADAAVVNDEWKHSLWSQVHQLPQGQRQSLVLRFSEELKYEEIAEILECPVGTVKSRVYHGLMALRRIFAEPEKKGPGETEGMHEAI